MAMIFVNDLSPVLFDFGFAEIRWYGLFFAAGLILNYLILVWIFKKEKLPGAQLESLAIYLFIGLVVGARLGHIVFYNLDYFLNYPLEIFAIWNGGLSSHGATIGLLIALFLWVYLHKVKFARYADLIAIPMPLTAAFVRLGNFFNSEIVGNPTGVDYGVIFKRLGEDFPRHPAQLYEGGALLLIFAVLMWMYLGGGKKKMALATARACPLFFMFSFILLYFTARFFIEYTKDLHVLPANFPLSMGQVLSILPILAAVIYFGITLFRPSHPQ